MPRAIFVVLLALSVCFVGDRLHPQPVVVPQLRTPSFQSSDLQPYFDTAKKTRDISSWERTLGYGLGLIQADWELQAEREILNFVSAVNISDTVNAVDAYRNFLLWELNLQKEEAGRNWELAAADVIRSERDAYLQDLARKKAGVQATDTKGQLSDAALNARLTECRGCEGGGANLSQIELRARIDSIWNQAEKDLSQSDLSWRRDFRRRQDKGTNEFNLALVQLGTEKKAVYDTIKRSDAEFKQRIADFDNAETKTRELIRANLSGLKNYLNRNDLFYEETCANTSDPGEENYNACSVDKNRRNAAGNRLQSLIDRMEKGLVRGDRLSLLATEMETFLGEQASFAGTHMTFWDGRIESEATSASPVYYDPDPNGDHHDNWIARDANVIAVKDFLKNGGSEDYIRNNLIFYETREIRGISGADMRGWSDDYNYGFLNFIIRTDGAGEWYSEAGDNFSVASTTSIVGNWPLVWIQTDVWGEKKLQFEIDYTAYDPNAEQNANRWAGYKSDIDAMFTSWRDDILPGVKNWESQTAQYKSNYDAWRVEADGQLRQADSAYEQGKNDILIKQSDWRRKMKLAYRQGNAGFADAKRKLVEKRKQATSVADEYFAGRKKSLLELKRLTNASLKNLFADLPSPVNVGTDIAMALKKASANFPNLKESFLNKAKENLPDMRDLGVFVKGFEQSVRGVMQLATVEGMQISAERTRAKVMESLRDALLSGNIKDGDTEQQRMNYAVEIQADGTLVATRQIKSGSIASVNGDATNPGSYVAAYKTQTIRIAAPLSSVLPDTGDIFGQWDLNKTFAAFDSAMRAMGKSSQQVQENFGKATRQANETAAKNAASFDRLVQSKVREAGLAKSVAEAMYGGSSFKDAVTGYANSTATSALASTWASALGVDPGLVSAFFSGGQLVGAKAALTSYAEGQFWSSIEQQTGIPGIAGVLSAEYGKAQARKAKREAGRFKAEDALTLGATYTWRNAQYRPSLNAVLSAAETVASYVAMGIPGLGQAAVMGYYSAKQAYLGSLRGGTKGALAGIATGVANSFTSRALVSASASYSFENGWGGSLGVNAPVAAKGFVRLGANVNFAEGRGITGSSIGAEYGPGGGVGGRLGFNFDRRGQFTNADVSMSYADPNKSGNQTDRYTGGLSISRAGKLAGVNLSASRTTQRTNANSYWNRNTSSTFGGGLAYNFADKTYSASTTVRTEAGNDYGFGFNSFGAGAVTNYTFKPGGKLDGVNQDITVSTTFQTKGEALLRLQGDMAAAKNKLKAGDLNPETRAKLENKIASLQTREQQLSRSYAETQYVQAAIENVKNDPKLLPEERSKKLAILKGYETSQSSTEKQSILDFAAQKVFNAKDGSPDSNIFSQSWDSLKNGLNYLVGVDSDANGYVDRNGKFYAKVCFTAGTLVRIKGGYRKIELIRAGDEVLAWNEGSQRLSYRKVAQTFIRQAHKIYKITYEDGTTVETTWNHRFWINGRGWVMAKDLKAEDVSLSARGLNAEAVLAGADHGLSIANVEMQDREEQVYNFEVARHHTYFVTTSEVLVHNESYVVKSGETPAALLARINADRTQRGLRTISTDDLKRAGIEESNQTAGERMASNTWGGFWAGDQIDVPDLQRGFFSRAVDAVGGFFRGIRDSFRGGYTPEPILQHQAGVPPTSRPGRWACNAASLSYMLSRAAGRQLDLATVHRAAGQNGGIDPNNTSYVLDNNRLATAAGVRGFTWTSGGRPTLAGLNRVFNSGQFVRLSIPGIPHFVVANGKEKIRNQTFITIMDPSRNTRIRYVNPENWRPYRDPTGRPFGSSTVTGYGYYRPTQRPR